MEIVHKEIAYCGLNCKTCVIKSIIKTSGEPGLQKLVKNWSDSRNKVNGKDLFCSSYCSNHQGIHSKCWHGCEIRKCGIRKGVDTCGACNEYPCSLIQSNIPTSSDSRKILQHIYETKKEKSCACDNISKINENIRC
jgi:hypothetical protein